MVMSVTVFLLYLCSTDAIFQHYSMLHIPGTEIEAAVQTASDLYRGMHSHRDSLNYQIGVVDEMLESYGNTDDSPMDTGGKALLLGIACRLTKPPAHSQCTPGSVSVKISDSPSGGDRICS